MIISVRCFVHACTPLLSEVESMKLFLMKFCLCTMPYPNQTSKTIFSKLPRQKLKVQKVKLYSDRARLARISLFIRLSSNTNMSFQNHLYNQVHIQNMKWAYF